MALSKMVYRKKLIVMVAVTLLTSSMVSINSVRADDLNAQAEHYHDLIDEKKLTEAQFNELAKLAVANPTNAKLQLAYGLALDFAGLPEEAEERFALADKYGPKDPMALVNLLRHLLSKGDQSAARSILEQAMKRFPDSPDVALIVGRALKENRNYVEAERVLARAYNMTPADKRPLGLATHLAEVYVQTDPAMALRLIKEDLARNPDFFMAQSLAANSYANLGEYRKAITPLSKLFAKSGMWGNTSELYTRCLFWDGRYNEAIQPGLYFLAKTSGAMGGKLPAVPMLSVLFDHVSSKQAKAAIDQFYQRTAKEDVVKPPFHYYLARALALSNRADLALNEINTFLTFDSSSFDAILFKAQLLENKLGEYDQALACYRLAHAILPYNAVCTNSLMRLEERIASRRTDLAWQFKDFFRKLLHLPPD